MLQAMVPASGAVIVHVRDSIYNYPPLTAAGDSVYVYDTATVNVLAGGSIGVDLVALSNSTANVSGSTIGNTLNARDNSTMTVSGGSIEYDLEGYDDSTVTVSGGSFWGGLVGYN